MISSAIKLVSHSGLSLLTCQDWHFVLSRITWVYAWTRSSHNSSGESKEENLNHSKRGSSSVYEVRPRGLHSFTTNHAFLCVFSISCPTQHCPLHILGRCRVFGDRTSPDANSVCPVHCRSKRMSSRLFLPSLQHKKGGSISSCETPHRGRNIV